MNTISRSPWPRSRWLWRSRRPPAAPTADNVVKLGVTDYDTHSKTNGISGIGVPPGADAEVGSATTAIFVYERLFTPNIGLEFVLGIPPRIKAKATGSVAFLGDDVLSAKNVAPTLLLNYHFFGSGAMPCGRMSAPASTTPSSPASARAWRPT